MDRHDVDAELERLIDVEYLPPVARVFHDLDVVLLTDPAPRLVERRNGQWRHLDGRAGVCNDADIDRAEGVLVADAGGDLLNRWMDRARTRVTSERRAVLDRDDAITTLREELRQATHPGCPQFAVGQLVVHTDLGPVHVDSVHCDTDGWTYDVSTVGRSRPRRTTALAVDACDLRAARAAA